ncbi:hypothetical protein EG329_011007 [Mollisiaceae sp. DMI_Dod_QoI]|nr:hypothetical protein EG329_011007 [Helotiales sp. DMI_Dod_QoI]
MPLSTSGSAQSLFTFKTGDVHIKVTYQDELVVGKVSSQAMALVSKPWQNFIFDPRAKFSRKAVPGEDLDEEAVRNPNQSLSRTPLDDERSSDECSNFGNTPVDEVDFTDDDGEALLILLRITHLQFDDVPLTLSYDLLLNVAIVCDQYDCVRIVKPWLSHWLSNEKNESLKDGHENWLWIAWVFGRSEVFEDLALRMLRTVKTNEEGECLTEKGEEVSDPMPPGILESILDARQRTVEALLRGPYSLIEKYENPSKLHEMLPEETYADLFTFDGGDIKLVATYKGKRVEGTVVTQSLVQASPVWKKALASQPLPQFSPAGRDTQQASNSHDARHSMVLKVKQIDCSGDDGGALLILLRIAHLRFHHIPKQVTVLELLNLSVLCEKYDCHNLLGPWCDDWMSPLMQPNSRKGSEDRWLYIAWTFGKQKAFECSALTLVMQVCLTALYNSTFNARALDDGPMPVKILDSILRTRTATIERLLAIPYSYIERFNNGQSTVCTIKSKSCDAILYGSLLLQLGQLSLWPKKNAEDIKSRVDSLAKNIRNLVITSLQTIPGAQGEDHSGCMAPSFKVEVDKIMTSIPSPVLEYHRSHIEKRNKSTDPKNKPSNDVENGEKKSLIVILKVKVAPHTLLRRTSMRPHWARPMMSLVG